MLLLCEYTSPTLISDFARRGGIPVMMKHLTTLIGRGVSSNHLSTDGIRGLRALKQFCRSEAPGMRQLLVGAGVLKLFSFVLDKLSFSAAYLVD